ncbi:MAG: transposase [Bacteroidales bacterium]|nr:transposase [Bacteroidales bacterium]
MYRQQSLITLDQFYEIKPLTKLEAILSFVDYSLLEKAFPIDYHRRGPKGYSKKQLLSVLLAMQTEQIVTLKALVQKLKTEPMFKRNCGFDYLDNTPSEATLNRFITQLSNTNILERTYRRMIHKAKALGLIDGTNVAIDASKITAYEHAVPKKYIPADDPHFPNWGGKLDTNGNFIKWFGWKMHALVDTISGIPLSYIITPANIADVDMAEPLIKKLMEDYDNSFAPKYYIMDAGYDKPDLYRSIHATYHAQAIIPINWRNTKVAPEGINFDGQLVCSMNYPYVYGGNDNGTIRILCPHVCGKCNCVMGSAWCTNAKSGYVGKVKIKDDPRFITAPFRGTEAYEKLYNQRTSVERTFGDLKDNYALDNLRVAKMNRAKVFMDLSCISMLASRLAATEKARHKSAA